MKTYLDCIPCFFRQAIDASELKGAGDRNKKRIICDIAAAIPSMDMRRSPPELDKKIIDILKKRLKTADIYREVKKKSNKRALAFYPHMKRRVAGSKDTMASAVKTAIAGNIIDCGAMQMSKMEESFTAALQKIKSGKKGRHARFDIKEFKGYAGRSRLILYLADNAGETVFDRILIEEIKESSPSARIVYAVKSRPALNDALERDARESGIDRCAEIFKSGSDIAGTVLSGCSARFRELFKSADMVISKGQGNYEALSESKRAVFFLFIAKCGVVAGHTGCAVGDGMLLYHEGKTKRGK
ncbi:MAG TPA: DUF89 family protein [bacterium]|nr:DUF89 family protein [bacterium]